MQQELTHEDALDQLDHDERAQGHYRFIESWFGLTPRQALRRLLRERAWEAKRDEQEAEQP